MGEFWGYCAACVRWFYGSSAAGGCQPANLACPVCLTPPDSVEVRIPDAVSDRLLVKPR